MLQFHLDGTDAIYYTQVKATLEEHKKATAHADTAGQNQLLGACNPNVTTIILATSLILSPIQGADIVLHDSRPGYLKDILPYVLSGN